MKKKEWYAVKKGRHIGLFRTWEECKAQVDGFTGAKYKGFVTKAEAEAYLRGEERATSFFPRDAGGKKSKATYKEPLIDPHRMTVYVDGSYMPEFPEAFSFGVVFLYQGEIYTVSKKIINPEEATMRNVAGEIHGAAFAMNACIKRGISEMDLYYDYAGIEKWCTGEWKRNKETTQAFKDYYDSVKDRLTVYFHKVESHTGVKYNEMADKLAKKALLGE